MELLLWVLFFDPKWFFISKISMNFFKFTWMIPLISHIFLVLYSVFILINSKFSFKDHSLKIADLFSECKRTLVIWIMSRIFFSLLIALNIIIFMCKIYSIENSEKRFFITCQSIFPDIKHVNKNCDFWIRRKSITSTPGFLLLLLGIISLIWSFFLINLHYLENKFQGCDLKVLSLINLNSIFVILGNIPFIILIFFKIILKVNSYLFSYLCPGCLKCTSQLFSHNLIELDKINFSTNKHFEAKPQDLKIYNY